MKIKTSKTPTIILTTLILAILLLILQPITTQAQSVQIAQPTQAGSIDPVELEAFMDGYITEKMDVHHIPGVVISFVKDSEIFFSKGYGYADLKNQTPMDVSETVLTTASLGKAFTAAAVLQLVDQGIIDLDEDIRPYIRHFDLPEDYPGTLTFAHLLTHTDGFEARVIGGGALSAEEMRPLEEMLADYIPAQIASPGETMTYGNFAANLAGYLVAEISGVPFEEYVAENILSPLDMESSTFDQRLSPEMRARVAEAYEYEHGEHVQMPFFYINNAPEGGLRTTARDMNRFILSLLNGGENLFSEDTAQLMFTQQFTADPKLAGITYGLFEHFENGHRALLRDGDGVGTRSRMVLLPEENMGFFVSYNSGDSNLRLDIISDFLAHYYPEDFANAPVPMEGYQERAKQFVGAYRPLQADTTTFAKSMFFFSQLMEVVEAEEGYLSIKSSGAGGDEQSSSFGGFEGTSLWVETAPLYFERVDGSGQLLFIQNDAGEITQMVSGQGYHSPFLKLPWYESFSFQIILIQLVVLLLISAVLSTFVNWPLGALIRKLRKKATDKPIVWGAVIARLWAGIVAGLFALLVFRAIGVLYAIDAIGGMPNFVWGINEEMVTVLNDIYLPVALALPLPIFTALAWGNRWWKKSTRIHYTLITLAVMGGIWWANYWNLLGFRI